MSYRVHSPAPEKVIIRSVRFQFRRKWRGLSSQHIRGWVCVVKYVPLDDAPRYAPVRGLGGVGRGRSGGAEIHHNGGRTVTLLPIGMKEGRSEETKKDGVEERMYNRVGEWVGWLVRITYDCKPTTHATRACITNERNTSNSPWCIQGRITGGYSRIATHTHTHTRTHTHTHTHARTHTHTHAHTRTHAHKPNYRVGKTLSPKKMLLTWVLLPPALSNMAPCSVAPMILP